MAVQSIVTWDFLADLMFPRHAVDYICEQDKAMLKSRLIRETFGLMKNYRNDGQHNMKSLRTQSPFFATSGSRTTSLRTPNISIFNDAEEKIGTSSSDLDFMVVHPDIIVGDPGHKMHLEFVQDENNFVYGRIKAVRGAEICPRLFTTYEENGTKYLNGNVVIDYVVKCYRDNLEAQKFKNWQRTGPAYERLNLADSETSKNMKKADIVVAIISTMDYFLEDRAEVMKKSCWPSEIKDLVLATPIFFVQVAPKSFEEPDLTWRVSFSMHEQIISQTLNFNQRQVYMVIKYITKYLLETQPIPECIGDKAVSSYMTMNSFFALCDLNPSKDWSVQKMVSILEFFKHFNGHLQAHCLPQYVLPQNNLFQEVTPEWCQFYAEIFDFADESAIVKLLIDAQQTWRIVQFERAIKPFWSGEELSLDAAKTVLKELSMDAVLHLEGVRAVQAMWNHSEIFNSLIGTQQHYQNYEGSTPTKYLEFWYEQLQDLKTLFDAKKISKENYVRLLALIQLMAPTEDINRLKTLIQEKFEFENAVKCEPKANFDTYFSVKYERHGEMDDCVIEYNDDDVIVQFANADHGRYIFPYTNHALLFSEPVLYLIVCQQALKNVKCSEVQMLFEKFPKNVPEDLRNHPLVRLITILKGFYFEDDATFPDFEYFKG